MPVYSLRDIVKDIKGLQPKEINKSEDPEILDKEESATENRYEISDEDKLILDFYAEFFS